MKETQESSKKINRILIIILIMLLLLTVITYIAVSLFSDSKTDNTEIRIGKLEVQLKEDWPEQGEGDYDEFGIKKYEKVVKGESVGDLPSYVRIKCVPIVQYYYVEEGQTEGKWITADVPQENIVLWISGSNWIREGEYYYYTKIVEGYAETQDLNISWQIAEIPSEIEKYDIRVDVRVILEYAQTTNDRWKEVFKIDSLPEGVEAFTQK